MKSIFENLDSDLQKSLWEKLKLFWTHSSTALEGNTLSLGETDLVLREGLTIGGKALKDHNEVIGHDRAIDILKKLLEKSSINFADLFQLHRAVQTEVIMDVYQPIGAWKVEHNSTSIVLNEKVVTNDTYAEPKDVEALMQVWLKMLNQSLKKEFKDYASLVKEYTRLHTSFVHIHPFADGNGRLARLLSNLPLLKQQQLPILVSKEKRMDYIRLLGAWQVAAGPIKTNQEMPVINPAYHEFEKFCLAIQQENQELVDEVHRVQEQRNNS